MVEETAKDAAEVADVATEVEEAEEREFDDVNVATAGDAEGTDSGTKAAAEVTPTTIELLVADVGAADAEVCWRQNW